ncbi:hypothetical protein Ciccas_005821 [Cichlidogyrus casuarinus]|uniref:Choline kinase beta n=1 Tax=Cichlidogyrus casuarinus TaxID=1844966 RepID=A0ABD2Q8N8_9PLAT
MRLLKCCVAKRLHSKCSEAFLGPWIDPANVDIIQIGGGLSNYLFMAFLKPDCVEDAASYPRKVLIRVYGNVLREGSDCVVLESIIFALLSEKKLGPALYSIFPCGRIEQYIDSRPLRTNELSLPVVSEYLARKMARIHRLQMPLMKQPVYIMETCKRYISQLSDWSKLPKRAVQELSVLADPTPLSERNPSLGSLIDEDLLEPNHLHKDIPYRHDVRSQGPEREGKPRLKTLQKRKKHSGSMDINPLLARCEKCSDSDYHESSPSSPDPTLIDEQIRRKVFGLAQQYRIVEEFDWLNNQLYSKYRNQFPVTFCHNDFQENNILVVPDQRDIGKIRLLPIDYEYCSYNFRGFDIGNHFNEMCFEYSDQLNDEGFITKENGFPNEEQQLKFLHHYLQAFYRLTGDSDDYNECLLYDPSSDDKFEDSDARIPSSLTNLINLRQSQEETGDLDQLPLSDWEKDPRNLLLEVYYGALTSHFFWGVWSLIQTLMSNIEFNFLQYAEARFKMYQDMKQSHRKKEAHLTNEETLQ